MSTTQRRRPASVIARLLARPQLFELIQAIRMLDLWLRRNGVARDETLARHVRFQNSVSMNFPASAIEALSAQAENVIDCDRTLQSAFMNAQFRYIRFTPASMGFLGVNGVLPNRYTEDVAAQIQSKKYEGTRAFFDIFSNRFMALHYQAWNKHRVRQGIDPQGADALLPIQLALAGARPGSGALSRRAGSAAADDIDDEAPARYAALLRQRPASASAIAGVLTEYFGVPVKVVQFVGSWDVLDDASLTKLGKQNATLGMGAMLGPRCWERHSHVELRIGPLSMPQYEHFLPGASGARAIARMLALFSTPALEFQIRLVLRAEEVKPVVLGVPTSARLGAGAFLVTRPSMIERDDLVYILGTRQARIPAHP